MNLFKAQLQSLLGDCVFDRQSFNEQIKYGARPLEAVALCMPDNEAISEFQTICSGADSRYVTHNVQNEILIEVINGTAPSLEADAAKYPEQRQLAVLYGDVTNRNQLTVEITENVFVDSDEDDEEDRDLMLPASQSPVNTDRKAQPFDIVQKPAHYNLHPSGVECIELAELMTFNTGNAFKYVFRRGDKGKAKQDVEKALWYVEKEIVRINTLLKYVPLYILRKYQANHTFTEDDERKASLVLKAETDPVVRRIYSSLFMRCTIRDYRYELNTVVTEMQKLLESMDATE